MDKANILLVDDQPGKLMSYEAILGELNQNLVLARSGLEALQFLLKEEFALILLDVVMPQMDGFETAAMIRQRPRLEETPIIFLTSHTASDLDRLKGYELGAVDFVFAPVIPRILLHKVAVFVELYRKRKELAEANERLRGEIAERQRAQEQALQAERLAAIGQMVAGLAHESRNSLQQIHAAADMLSRRLGPGTEMALVGEINVAQDRLHRLLEAVRHYAAPLKLNRETRDLAPLWRAAWAELGARRHGRSINFREEISDVDTRCPVDVCAIERLFRSLFENALDAGRGPLEITIRASAGEMAGRPAVKVQVQDNGIGLSEEQARRAFEPFYTTKIGGTGLGLAMAKRVVEAHGGRIHVDLVARPGTIIEVLLPKGSP